MARRSAVFVLLLLLTPLVAAAQPSPSDKSLAQSLFEQGKTLMEGGNYEQACPKLEESQRLDPGGGTLMNLALCHERQGKLATAWSEFKEALSAAKRDERQDRVDAASEHIATLEPKLPWLTLVVASESADQIVKLDGAPLGKAAWGTPVAIDPGAHELASSAPGRKPWASGLTIALAEKKTLEVPQLQVDPSAAAAPAVTPPSAAPSAPAQSAPAPTAPTTPSERRGSGNAMGWVIGGAGVAGLGVGTFFGIRTLSKKKQSDDLCPTDATCTERGVQLNNEAKTSAWISNIGFGLGLVGVGVGTYLLVSSSGSDETAQSTAPARGLALRAGFTPGGGGLSLTGAF